MSSLALYRRYRPETFAEVIGQEHVTDPLQQALRNNRVNHAYLFSGPRGCGKTTSARILARCLNCEQGPTPTPCGACQSCRDLARNGPGSIDVIEIDAASHGGVDDARDLREKAFFGPASSRYKIYIIDEAHMVTPAGFNALLKVVEEPPEHLKFIFATTEPEKVIGTIRSRTHHYPFRLVPPGTLRDYLAEVCEREAIPVDDAVLPLAVRAGAGSVRDSMSVMDQLLAGAGEEGVTYAMATALLGYTDSALLDEVVEAFAAGDGAVAFEVVDRVIEGGHDPRRFVADLLERLRDLVILAAVPGAVEKGLIDAPADVVDRMAGQARTFGPAELSRAADLANTGLTEMRGATSPRLQLELICARILLPATYGDERSVQARLDRLERSGLTGGLPTGGVPTGGVAAEGPSGPAAARAALGGGAGAGRPPAPAEAGGEAGGAQNASTPAAPQAQPGSAAGEDPGPGPGGDPDGWPEGATPAPSGHAGPQGAAPPGSGEPGGAGSTAGPRPGAWPAGTAPGEPQAAGAARTGAPASSGPGGAEAPAPGHTPGAWPTGAGASQGAGAAGAPERRPGEWPGATSPGAARPPRSAAPADPAQAGPASGPGGQEGQGSGGPAAPGGSSSGAGGQRPGGHPGNRAGGPQTPAPDSAQGAAQIRQMWPQILEAVKNRRRFTWILLSQNAQVAGFDGTTLQIGFTTTGARDSFVGGGSADVLVQALQDAVGVQWKVEAIVDPSGGAGQGPAGGGRGGGPGPGPHQGPGGGTGTGGWGTAASQEPGAGGVPRPASPPAGGDGPPPARPGGTAAGGEPASGAGGARQALAYAQAAPSAAGRQAAEPPPSAGPAPAVPSSPPAFEDDMPADDDADLDETALSGYDLLVRELGATVIEEIQHD